MKKVVFVSLITVLLVLGGIWAVNSSQKSDPDVLSYNGLHWHPELAIYVKGIKQDIPSNVGVGPQYAGMTGYHTEMMMTDMHTHDDLPSLHLEFMGAVRKQDTMLGQFFKIWGKEMRSFGTNMQMTVNGTPNTEYENYMMRDGDKIELRYE